MSNPKIRPAVKWAGGQFYNLPYLLPKLHKGMELLGPEHVYCEAYGGMASLLLNKNPSPVEVYNDINPRLYRFFRVLRERPEEFRRKLTLTPYSRKEFDERDEEACTDELELARRDFVMWRQSFGGQGDGWSRSLSRSRRGMADVVSGYLSAIDENLPLVINRFRTVQLEHLPTRKMIQEYAAANVIWYFDPPFFSKARKSTGKLYEFQMAEEPGETEEEAHRNLGELLRTIPGLWMLSGYNHPLYEEIYQGFPMESAEVANHQAGGNVKSVMTPCIWSNF